MSFLNILKKTKTGIITFALVFSLFSGILPEKSYAYMGVADITFDPTNLVQNTIGAVGTVAQKVKEYILDPLAWTIAKRIVNGLTEQTVNWINSGFNGNPAFISDPGQFFLDIGDKSVSQFLSSTGLNQLCTPFKLQVRLALLQNYLRSTNHNNDYFSCTLDKIKDNYTQFTRDFKVGGWRGWFEVTQHDTNNPLGVYVLGRQAMSNQGQDQIAKYQSQIDQGQGFLSWETCPEGTEVTAQNAHQWSVEDNARNGTNYEDYQPGQCRDANNTHFGDTPKQVNTPGSVINSQLEKQLGSGIDQLNLADSLNEIIGALISQLTQKITGGLGKGGLRGAYGSKLGGDVTGGVSGGPIVSILGDSPMQIYLNSVFTDPRSIAYDQNDGDITNKVVTTGSVDTGTPGVYTLTYNVTNSKGVKATPATRDVVVLSQTQPVGGGGFPPVICTTTNGVMTCNVGGSGTGGTGTGGTGTGGGPATPSITSITPSAAIPGQTPLTINGSNLSPTIQFFDSNGNLVNTGNGQVNGTKTQVVVITPGNLQQGPASLKDYASDTAISNALTFQVFSSNGPQTVQITNPLEVWAPQQTQNGWWPELSSDGRFITYGSWGESWITDLLSKQSFNFSFPLTLPLGAKCRGGQWFNLNTASFVCSNIPGQTGYWRYEVKTGEWIARKTSDDPDLVIGDEIKMRDGHWASWKSAGQRLAEDNNTLASSVGGALSLSGNDVVHACDNSNNAICVRNGLTIARQYIPQVPLFKTDVNASYILYGGFGTVHGIDPNGKDVDLSLSPKYKEDIGRVFFVSVTPWVVTTGWDAQDSSKGYVFIRPWGDFSAIALDASNAQNVTIAVSGTNFIVAFNDNTGLLKVETVSMNAPRSPLPR